MHLNFDKCDVILVFFIFNWIMRREQIVIAEIRSIGTGNAAANQQRMHRQTAHINRHSVRACLIADTEPVYACDWSGLARYVPFTFVGAPCQCHAPLTTLRCNWFICPEIDAQVDVIIIIRPAAVTEIVAPVTT